MPRVAILLAVIAACMMSLVPGTSAQAQRNPGISTVCGEFTIGLDLFFVTIGFDRPDEGWAWVDTSRKFRQATGIAHNVHVASNDTPANHESHDADFLVQLDPGQEDLLSTQADNSLPIEWETGIGPNEKTGDGAAPIYPKWAWPSNGDRVWVNGNWIFDCGHPTNGLYKTEIHPARAIASMRAQAHPLPGTGTTPVPVTLTDLYITGRGGFAPQQLNCGPDIILGPNGDTCGQSTPPADESYKTSPIDVDFTFDVCLPPRPLPNAVISRRADLGPGNTVSVAPLIEPMEAAAPCLGDPQYDQGTMLRLTVPLANTSTPPTATYARRIYAGWLVPPDPVLPLRRVTLEHVDLHEDHDLDPGDGELTFWWLNVDRAERTWLRLSDFTSGMDDYDDDFSFGDGIKTFTPDAKYEFYLRHGQPFTLFATGFEQDCFDNVVNGAFFGHHQLELIMYAICYAPSAINDFGAGDAIANAEGTFSESDLGSKEISGGGQYEIKFNIEEVAHTFEDQTFLSIGTQCTPADEVALVGQPLTCATRADNAGPGLPRAVQISTQFSGPPLAVVDSATWAIRPPFGNGTYGCTVASASADCRPDSVPVAAATPVNVTTIGTPARPGLLTHLVDVTTASTDPDLTNNADSVTVEVFDPVVVDISPKDDTNVINLRRGGSMTVAILTTAQFDARSINPLSVCFGDAEAVTERSCSEQHLTGHFEDVNKDKLPDLVLHYAVASTGIDAGDVRACLRARTTAGVGLFGCDVVSTR